MSTIGVMRWDTREPCESCPYRKDAPIKKWDRAEFEDLLAHDANELGGAVYGCHGTKKRVEGPSVCAGWLLDQQRRDFPSIQLRLLLMSNAAAAEIFGVSKTAVAQVRRRETWKHVK